MCGFVGEIRFKGDLTPLDKLQEMADVISPRGPDSFGAFVQDRFALLHRRLKIIDLSDKAAQPMTDNLLGLTIVFNGAIYNYKELRSLLEQKGYQFFSSGDTEVILKAYHAFGKECVQHFNGMFAFSIYEHASGKLFMARDRLGIKPFYYQRKEEFFRFSSTLPSLLKSGDVDTEIDKVALNYYMSFHAVVPAPHTILKGIRKLPPATIAEISRDGEFKSSCYWQPEYKVSESDNKKTESEWKEVVFNALQDSVKRRLVADVPVGVLLSGGVDSSLIVALLKRLGQKDINTFSVGFADVPEEEGNEFRYSDLIAKEFSTTHHKINATDKDLLDNLSHCIQSMSEPMVSHDAIGFYLLSKEVSKHVKVVQSGQGADEVFAGYHWYPPLMNLTEKEAAANYSFVFFDRDFAEYKQVVSDDYLGEDYASKFVKNHFAMQGANSAIDKALRLDTNIMLVDDPVKRVDNMTMAFGLEARVPFLDHELVELAARIPAKYKVKQGGKHILKEVARMILPHEVIDRPKGYFPVPALKYLDREYLQFVKDIIGSDKAKYRGVFRQEYIDNLCQNPKEHITPLRGSKLWQIALLEHWLQTQNV